MRSLLKLLFVFTLLELYLGGGGRVFEIGSTTLRILLFFSNIALVGVIYLFQSKIPTYAIQISVAVLCLLIFYVVLGWLNGILFYFGKIDFNLFYNYVNTQLASTEFFFRGNKGLFFYKGFLYMVIGLIFWIHTDNSKFKGLAILIITTAMILSGTRGLILMFIILYALFYGLPLLLKLNLKILILTVAVIFGSLFFFKNIELGNKNLSDSIRMQQIQQVIEQIDPISLFIGHGFGNGVPIRPVHMEIGYLEVFHKQGILGLAVWFIFFTILYNAYVREKTYLAIRRALFLSILFVILISLTNPFFNNPIGISLFIISLSVFWKLNQIGIHPENFQKHK